MKNERYNCHAQKDLLHFEFYSIGPKGKIRKIVEYSETNVPNVYNLAFGDYNDLTGKIDDGVVTNNGDSLKVLSTVAASVYAFTNRYPGAWVFATGSNKVRTRLYRMGLTNYLNEIKFDFEVYGLSDQGWNEFIVGEEYEAFMVRKKSLNL